MSNLSQELKQKVQNISESFEQDLEKHKIKGKFDDLYLKYFSKKNGLTNDLLKNLKELSIESKKEFGLILNELQNKQKRAIEAAKTAYETVEIDKSFDISSPHKPKRGGKLHPLTQVIIETNNFFRYHGFSICEGPEIETAEYNFRKLNLPEGHPATDLQDTLFINEPNILLRTHTSSIESRILSTNTPPIRAAFVGKCFRNETPSPTNVPFFHQYQGVVVDKDINIKHLMDILEKFHKFLFGDDTKVRFRYKYYPEVSPGLGADMMCKFCHGEGCTICKQRGWIEVLGSGMIHYNTLKMCGIDPEIYTGYAFGIGFDRIALQKTGITDIRHMFGGDLVIGE